MFEVADSRLGFMGGYEVASRRREEPWGADVFMVACTGWGQPEDRRRSHDAGFNRHLVKPVSLDAVLKLLDDLADAKSG
jgi:CheY-like chemotaxis protein